MIISVAKANIQKPIEEVFAYLEALDNQTEYNSSVKSAKKREGALEYEISIDLGFFSMKEVYRVIEKRLPHLLLCRCEGKSMAFEDEYLLESNGNSTDIQITDKMELKGLLSWSEPIAHPILKSQMQDNLNRLKSILESRPQ